MVITLNKVSELLKLAHSDSITTVELLYGKNKFRDLIDSIIRDWNREPDANDWMSDEVACILERVTSNIYVRHVLGTDRCYNIDRIIKHSLYVIPEPDEIFRRLSNCDEHLLKAYIAEGLFTGLDELYASIFIVMGDTTGMNKMTGKSYRHLSADCEEARAWNNARRCALLGNCGPALRKFLSVDNEAYGQLWRVLEENCS